MSAVSSYINGPYEGVSQVPPQVRLQGACSVMEDCLAIIPTGLTKRPPMLHRGLLKDLSAAVLPTDTNAIFINIPRGKKSPDDLTLMVARNGIHRKVYLFNTSTWAPVPITASAPALAYLDISTPIPSAELRAFPIEDVVFLTNRLVPTAINADVAATRPHEAIVWVKLGGFGRHIEVTVQPLGGTLVTAWVETPAGDQAYHARAVVTDFIADALYDGLPSDPQGADDSTTHLIDLVGQGFTVTLIGSLIYISHPTIDFTIAVKDDAGGSAVVGIKEAVQRVSDLPALNVNGFVVRIAQEGVGGTSDYWVKFKATGTTTTGIYEETLAPGAPLGLNPSTMPVVLSQDNLGVWSLDIGSWKRRTTGDDKHSPDPAFVGSSVEALSWIDGRLELTSGGSVDLSASDDPYSFYTSTLTTSKDSDPVGFLPPDDVKVYFQNAITKDATLVVFADKSQAGIQTLDPQVKEGNSGLKSVGNTAFNDQLPVSRVDRRAYYMATTSTSAIIYELSLDRISDKQVADEITLSVPTYMPNTIDRVSVSDALWMRLHGTSGGSRFYVNIVRYNKAGEVQQNHWSAWNLPSDFLFCGGYCKDTVWYILAGDPQGSMHVFTIDLSPLAVDEGGRLLQYLDLRVSDEDCSVVYDAGTNLTTYTLPQGIPATDRTIASVRVPGSADRPEGYLPPVASRTATTVVLQGPWADVPLWLGRTFDSYFTPSTFYSFGQDQRPLVDARLVISRLKADVARFGYLRIEVSGPGRATRAYVHEGYQLEDAQTPLDLAALKETNVMEASVGLKNVEARVKFINDSHLGFTLIGYEWAGDLARRTQRQT